ncbi:MAG TPA: phosphoribosylformylglycinamidine synthase subunit PurS [Ignavibacteria bacterium]|nr:phosphoribosylformylglycinamidine synthase subunit PurS [Ignavibacteria bacterium]
MYSAKIKITLRKSILDPQGKAVEHSIQSLGFKNILDTRIGKYVELKIDTNSDEEARVVTDEVCRKLLANQVMEDYVFEVESVSAGK